MRVEALGLDHGLAQRAVAALVLETGDMFARALMGAGGRRENPDFAIGENTVDIEQDEFDFLRPSLGGIFAWHRRILAFAE